MATWNEHYLDQELRNSHTVKIRRRVWKIQDVLTSQETLTNVMGRAEMGSTTHGKDRGLYAKMEMLK